MTQPGFDFAAPAPTPVQRRHAAADRALAKVTRERGRPWRDEMRDGAVYVRISDAYVPALLEGIGPVQKMRLVQIGGEWSIEVTQS